MFYYDVNWLAVLIAAIANMAIGALWFSPMLFGKSWMQLSGMTSAKIKVAKKGMMQKYSVAFIGSLLMAYVLAVIFELTSTITLATASKMAVLVWLGFIVPVMLGVVLWEGKPVTLYLMNVLYYLVAVLVMATVLILVSV